MVKVKICGITNSEDAKKAVYYGASAIGFIFHKKSPRYISPSKARIIIEELPAFVTPVGVFVNSGERAIREICRLTRISTIQLHGEEEPRFCMRFKDYKIIKAFRVGEGFTLENVLKYKVDGYLFDTYEEGVQGGTGKTFNWDLLANVKLDKPLILSGGLTSDNVRQAIDTVKPAVVDVSSGVETSPGIKNHRAMKVFFDMVKFSLSPVPEKV